MRQHWVRAVFCLLLAFGTIFHLGHPTPVQAHATVVQAVGAGDGAEPCEPGRVTPGEHCQITNTCPLFVPPGTEVPTLDTKPMQPFVTAEVLALSRLAFSHFRPPRLPLQG